MNRSVFSILLILYLLPHSLYAEDLPVIRWGVFAFLGEERTRDMYEPLAKYVDEYLADYRIELKILPIDGIKEGIRDRALDIVTTNPTHFIMVRYEYPLTGVISTLVSLDKDSLPLNSLAGVIVSRADNPLIKDLSDIKGRVIAAPSTSNMGGYRTQAYELLMIGYRLNPDHIIETQSHQKAVKTVLEGDADVAFVRSGVLEDMHRMGLLDTKDVRVINEQYSSEFRMRHSTRLYPEWPVFALPHVGSDVLRVFAMALFSLKPSHPAAVSAGIYGYTIPADYQVVEDMTKALGLPPFEGYGYITLRSVIEQYWSIIVGAIAFIAIISLLLLVSVVQKRKIAKYVKELEDSRREFENLAAQSHTISWEVDNTGRYTAITGVVEEILGYKPEEVVGRLFFHDFFPQESRDQKKKEILDLMSKGLPAHDFLNDNCDRDGKIHCFSTNAIPLYHSDGSLRGYRGSDRDITKQIDAQMALVQERDTVTTLFETSPVALFVLNRDTEIYRVNRAAATLCGVSPDEMIGRRPGEILGCVHSFENGCGESTVCRFCPARMGIETLLSEGGGKIENAEIPLTVRRDGVESPIWIVLNGATIQYEMDRAVCLSVFDITQRKNHEEILLAARKAAEEANEVKSEFLANMSHELRTPLNGILGFTALLQRMDNSPVQEKYLSFVHESGERLLAIIEDILELSKIEAGELVLDFAPLSLEELVDISLLSLSSQAEQKGIALRYIQETRLPSQVFGDALRLSQIFINLLGNAVKFTESGEVSVGLSYRGDSEILALTVSDTGVGISKEGQSRIFRAFGQADSSITRKYGGTGLGLVITKSLVDAMGGDISLESEEGVGTSVKVTIPMRVVEWDCEKSNSSNEDIEVEAKRSFSNILIVDDDIVNLMLINCVMEETYPLATIAEATDGKEALKLFDDGCFDLVILDIHMPGITGIEVVKEIRSRERERGVHTHVYALTADVYEDHREKCLDAGFDGFLGKPFSVTDLIALLEEAGDER